MSQCCTKLVDAIWSANILCTVGNLKLGWCGYLQINMGLISIIDRNIHRLMDSYKSANQIRGHYRMDQFKSFITVAHLCLSRFEIKTFKMLKFRYFEYFSSRFQVLLNPVLLIFCLSKLVKTCSWSYKTTFSDWCAGRLSQCAILSSTLWRLWARLWVTISSSFTINMPSHLQANKMAISQ